MSGPFPTTGNAADPAQTGMFAKTYYSAVILMLVYCFAFVDRQIFTLMVGPIKRDFGVSDLDIGYLLGPAFILSYVTVGLPAGWCVDRFQRSRLILVAGIAWGIGTALAAFTDSYGGLFFSRLCVGASEAFVYPAGMSLLADLYDRRRLPIVSSMFVAAPALGGGLSLLGGGYLLNATERAHQIGLPLIGAMRGWQLTLLVIALVGMIPVLLMLTVPDATRRRGAATAESSGEASYGLIDGTLYMVRRWRFYLTFFFGMACSSMVMLTVSAWAPTYLARAYNLNPAQIGASYGVLVLVFGIAGSVAAPAINAGMARWNADPTAQTTRLGPIMLVLFAASLWFVHSEGMALACLAALTFSYTFPLSMATTSLQLAAPSRLRGVASAYYFVAVSLIGYGIGPTAVPLITEHVFHDPARIGPAMSLIAVIFGSLSIVLLSISIGGFRREIQSEN